MLIPLRAHRRLGEAGGPVAKHSTWQITLAVLIAGLVLALFSGADERSVAVVAMVLAFVVFARVVLQALK